LTAFGVTFSGLALSLFLATLANQKIMGLPYYRTAMLWTYGIAPPVSGIIWLFIFHPSYGILTSYGDAASGVEPCHGCCDDGSSAAGAGGDSNATLVRPRTDRE